MTSIGVVLRSGKPSYMCNECDVGISYNESYVRSIRGFMVLQNHVRCAIPLVQHGWLRLLRLPDGEVLTWSTTAERWQELQNAIGVQE